MTTEYDRMVLRSVLSQFLPSKELTKLGVNAAKATKSFEKVSVAVERVSSIREQSKSILVEKLDAKITKLDLEIKRLKDMDTSHLSEKRQLDHQDKLDVLEERLKETKKMHDPESRYDRQKQNQAVQRLASKSIKESDILKRKRGAGAPQLLDSEDEEFIAASIESKSSYHGRRHDAVMYTNHRIKESHLLSIANYNLFKKGKKLIKSSKTVLLRSRPSNRRTREGMRHCGKWLFCAKKPPKTGLEKNESIHYQRAFVKTTRLQMYHQDIRNCSLDISMDDKAYVRPGTDVGFRTSKAGRIFTLSDEEKQRVLPQHDFPVPQVCQTPSSFRVMTWETQSIDGKIGLEKKKDQSFVEIRPKYFIGSSGSIWASSLLNLIYKQPQHFITDGYKETDLFASMLLRVHNALKYFVMTTTDEDLESLLSGAQQFVEYERKRLTHLHDRISQFIATWQTSKEFTAEQRTNTGAICISILQISHRCKALLVSIGDADRAVSNTFTSLVELCNSVLAVLDTACPIIKPFIAEYTDAGPGVGVSNHQVQIRFAEMALLQNSESRIRLHRAPGDSGQNESERTNAYIGDSLVDGAALNWQHYDTFHGLSEEDVRGMEYEEFQDHLHSITEKNAWATAEEISIRIDDEPGPSGGFLKSYVVQKIDNQFFNNTSDLMTFLHASGTNRLCIPGHGYFSKIEKFMNVHCRLGRYFIDYQRSRCEEGQEDEVTCEFCCPRRFPTFPKFIQPFPDFSQLPKFHYAHWEILNSEQTKTQVDEYQPKVQLDRMYSEGLISGKKVDAIEQFSQKYIVPKDIIASGLQDLEFKKLQKEKRLKKATDVRNLEKNKNFGDIDWKELIVGSHLPNVSVIVLNKYLDNFSIKKPRTKVEKVKAIVEHYTSTSGAVLVTPVTPVVPVTPPGVVNEDGASEDESDVVVAGYDTSDDDDLDSADDSAEEYSDVENRQEEDHDDRIEHFINTLNRQTRSGRYSKARYLDDYI